MLTAIIVIGEFYGAAKIESAERGVFQTKLVYHLRHRRHVTQR